MTPDTFFIVSEFDCELFFLYFVRVFAYFCIIFLVYEMKLL